VNQRLGVIEERFHRRLGLHLVDPAAAVRHADALDTGKGPLVQRGSLDERAAQQTGKLGVVVRLKIKVRVAVQLPLRQE
jgi:hypothetical protein